MAPSTYQAPQPLHRPLILSEWSPFPGSELPVLCIISCGSCFSYIPHSCKTQPSSPQNSCSWPRHSLLHARSAALRHCSQLGLGQSVVGTILCAVGCLAAPLVPAHWMSVASPHTHTHQSCQSKLSPGFTKGPWETRPLCLATTVLDYGHCLK